MSDNPPAESRERRELPGKEAIAGMRDISEETAQKLIGLIESSHPVRALRGSQVATAIVATIGLALFIVGVERAAEDIPIIKNEWGSIIVGLAFLAAAGALLRRLTH